MIACGSGASLTDHFYGPDGEKSLALAARNLLIGCFQYGFWQGAGLDFAVSDVTGFTFADVGENPSASLGLPARPSASCSAPAPRPERRLSGVSGRSLTARSWMR